MTTSTAVREGYAEEVACYDRLKADVLALEEGMRAASEASVAARALATRVAVQAEALDRNSPVVSPHAIKAVHNAADYIESCFDDGAGLDDVVELVELMDVACKHLRLVNGGGDDA